MKEENLKALEKQLFYNDMKEISRDELIRNMKEGKEAFSLPLTKVFGTATATAKVNFGLSKEKNIFVNSFDLTVKHEGKPDYTRNYKFKRAEPIISVNDAGEEKKQWINSTLTFKEAFNQMEGRAVNKDYVYVDEKEPKNNRKYNAWEYIDFTKPDANGICPVVKEYNFNLEKKLEGLPLPVLANEESAKKFMDSLKRGNIQMTDYTKHDGTTDKMYFEANPKHNMVNQYDTDMKPVLLSIKLPQETSESLTQQADQKQDSSMSTDEQKAADITDEDTRQSHSSGLRA